LPPPLVPLALPLAAPVPTPAVAVPFPAPPLALPPLAVEELAPPVTLLLPGLATLPAVALASSLWSIGLLLALASPLVVDGSWLTRPLLAAEIPPTSVALPPCAVLSLSPPEPLPPSPVNDNALLSPP
jgi:hypothetical protein